MCECRDVMVVSTQWLHSPISWEKRNREGRKKLRSGKRRKESIKSCEVVYFSAWQPFVIAGTVAFPPNEVLVAAPTTTTVEDFVYDMFFFAVRGDDGARSRVGSGRERDVVVRNVRFQVRGMKGGKGGGRKVKCIRRERRIRMGNFIRAIPTNHELGHAVVTSLHVVTTTMERRKEDFIAFFEVRVRTARGVCCVRLVDFSDEQVVLCLESVCVKLEDDVFGG